MYFVSPFLGVYIHKLEEYEITKYCLSTLKTLNGMLLENIFLHSFTPVCLEKRTVDDL